MKTSTIYRKTMVYSWLKLALCVASEAIVLLLFFLLYNGLSAVGEGPGAAGFIFWLILVPLVYPLAKYFFGHRIIAGHLDAVSEAIFTERLPVDLLKAIDKETLAVFPTFAHYKERELEVSNSVKQLYQRIADSVDLFEGVNSKDWVKKIVFKATPIYLAYISAACLSQIFVTPSQMQEKVIARSVGVFFRNWKSFLSDIYKSTLKIMLTVTVIGLICISVGITITVIIAGANIMTVALGIVMGALLTNGIKNAFIDPAKIIKMMKLFSTVNAEDKDDSDSYPKMALLSPAYTKLLKKAGTLIEKETDQAGTIVPNNVEN